MSDGAAEVGRLIMAEGGKFGLGCLVATGMAAAAGGQWFTQHKRSAATVPCDSPGALEVFGRTNLGGGQACVEPLSVPVFGEVRTVEIASMITGFWFLLAALLIGGILIYAAERATAEGN